MPSHGATSFNYARARRLAECDSGEDYRDELDRQKTEDEFKEAKAERLAEDED